jgi:hypothetical protein
MRQPNEYSAQLDHIMIDPSTAAHCHLSNLLTTRLSVDKLDFRKHQSRKEGNPVKLFT